MRRAPAMRPGEQSLAAGRFHCDRSPSEVSSEAALVPGIGGSRRIPGSEAHGSLMATPDQTTAVVFVGVLALLSWRMYSRVRRMVGRQRFYPRRPWVTVIVFPLLLLTLGADAFTHGATGFALLAGIGVGTALGLYGLQLTKFEDASDGPHYTPNAHIGIALSTVLVARILYRLVPAILAGGGPAPPDQVARSPLTLFIIGMLAGYYVTYAIGLIRWSRTLRRSDAPASRSPSDPPA